jgi:hypothetical protein
MYGGERSGLFRALRPKWMASNGREPRSRSMRYKEGVKNTDRPLPLLVSRRPVFT